MGEVAKRAGPLSGKTVLVTRGLEQCGELRGQLEERGARALVVPMVRFALPEDTAGLDGALQNVAKFDWWLLTSQNAAQFAGKRATALGIELATVVSGVKIAAVGPATAEAAEKSGLRVNYVARTHSGASLADELGGKVKGKRVLLIRSELADDSTPVLLRESGADVACVVGYRVLGPDEKAQRELRAIDWTEVDAAMFFSPSALRFFREGLGSKVHALCDDMVFVAIGPTTERAIR